MIRRSVWAGIIPILDTIVAVGTIHIPGRMTGRLLTGQDRGDAARRPIFILFSTGGRVALGSMGMVCAGRGLVFDGGTCVYAVSARDEPSSAIGGFPAPVRSATPRLE